MEGRVSPLYLFTAFGLALVAPAICVAFEPTTAAFVKWMAFWPIGVRLGLAGLRQTWDPRFTAEKIFNVTESSALPIVREIGLANLSFAALGLASIFVPAWRLPAILVGGVYFGLAAAGHVGHRPATQTEWAALVSDVLVFIGLAAAFICGAIR